VSSFADASSFKIMQASLSRPYRLSHLFPSFRLVLEWELAALASVQLLAPGWALASVQVSVLASVQASVLAWGQAWALAWGLAWGLVSALASALSLLQWLD